MAAFAHANVFCVRHTSASPPKGALAVEGGLVRLPRSGVSATQAFVSQTRLERTGGGRLSEPARRPRQPAVAASLGTAVAPKIEITKADSIEALASFAPWTLEGPNKQWTLWVCEPSEFPWVYDCDEYAYVLQGTFTVQYEGEEPVEINGGDFVHFSPGTTTFVVKKSVRKFYHLAK